MSLDAIETISIAEENAAKAKTEAAITAKKMLAQAENSGKNSVSQAKKRAEEELSELRAADREKAREEAMKLARTTENRKAAMLARADSRAEKAVELVIERIVNG